MYRNFIKTAFRNLYRQKLYTVVNILGLTIGVCVFTFIVLYVSEQLKYDQAHVNKDRIYRMDYDDWALLGPVYATQIKNQFPEIENVTRVGYSNPVLRYNGKRIRVNYFAFADSSVFDVLTLPFVAGDPKKALTDPLTVVITESTAHKFFGNENPMGKTLRYNNNLNFRITGVIRDVNNFHLKMEAIASFVSMPIIMEAPDFLKWTGNWNYFTYLLLSPGTDVQRLTRKIIAFYKENGLEEDASKIHLKPFTDIYFGKPSKHEYMIIHGDRQVVDLFIIVSIFILIIASVNFINLSTASAAGRAKEIGIRKVLGSGKKKLIWQLLAEAIFISLAAMILAVALAEVLTPAFNTLAGTKVNIDFLQPATLLYFLGGSIALGILAGIYPAFYLTSFEPTIVLKKEVTKGKKGAFFRKGLIVFQFAISIFLLAVTLVVYAQMRFIQSKDLGFDKENVIVFPINSDVRSRMEDFRNELQKIKQVENVSFTNSLPGSITWTESLEMNGKKYSFFLMPVDAQFFDVMKTPFAEGHNFDKTNKSDMEKNCILNEEAVKYFGIKNPVGYKFNSNHWIDAGNVIGVVKDFHFNSLHDAIGPVVFFWKNDWMNNVMVRIYGGNPAQTITAIEKVYEKFAPEFPFEWHFLDQTYDTQYKAEQRFGKIFGYFSAIAVFIACMGLFCLASYFAFQRKKEIGIRKVFGASEKNILLLLTRDFSLWVLLGNIIAWPIAVLLMTNWLNNFAYHITFPYYSLVIAALIALLLALITVSWQAIKTSRTNPSDALKYE